MTTVKKCFKRLRSRLRGEDGMTLIYAAVSLAFIGFMGMTVTNIGAADSDIAANVVDLFQAEANSTAGMEWAKWRLNNGQDPRSLRPVGVYMPLSARTAAPADPTLPVAATQTMYVIGPAPFGGGTFEVTSDPLNGSVTSIGKFGAATVSHSMQPTYAAECFEFFNVPDFNFSGTTEGSMNGVGFRLHCPEDCAASDSCLDTAIIKSMTVSWTKANDQQQVESVIVDDASPAFGDEVVSYNRDATNGWEVKGLPSAGAGSGTMINTIDFVIDDNDDHYFSTFAFQYDAGFRPESPDDFTITVYFKDGSTESVTYPYAINDEDDDGIADEYDDDDDGNGIPDSEEVMDTDGDDRADTPPGEILVSDPRCFNCGPDESDDDEDDGGGFDIDLIEVEDDNQPIPSIEGGIDPCMIGDDMGTEGGDGCASDGDPADTPGDCPGCDDNGGYYD